METSSIQSYKDEFISKNKEIAIRRYLISAKHLGPSYIFFLVLIKKKLGKESINTNQVY